VRGIPPEVRQTAAVAVLYGLPVGVFIHKELRWTDLPDILLQSGVTTSILLLVIGTAHILAWVLSAEEVPQKIATLLLGITTNPLLIMLLINLFLLVEIAVLFIVSYIPWVVLVIPKLLGYL
jgi:C4-dicarboxylate transporter DctM subunit